MPTRSLAAGCIRLVGSARSLSLSSGSYCRSARETARRHGRLRIAA
jgi:hypothetical protein